MKAIVSVIVAAWLQLANAAADRDAIFNWYKGTEPRNVLYAINCGSDDAVTDDAGITFEADRGFSGGQSSLEGYNQRKWPLSNTEVYQSERWHDEDFFYRLPVDTQIDQKLALVLKFSEIYFSNAGQKVFDVKIGNQMVKKNLDPLSLAYGKFLPYDVFVDLRLKGGKLYIDNAEAKGAIKQVQGQNYL